MEDSTKLITLANGAVTETSGQVSDVRIRFGKIAIPLDYIVMGNSPFDILIGRSALSQMGGVLDYPNKLLSLKKLGSRCDFASSEGTWSQRST